MASFSGLVRNLSPGESGSPRRGFQNEELFLSRMHIGQIQSIDTDNHTIDVFLLDINQLITVEVPTMSISFQRTSSSWQRAMPQTNDFVNISFDLTNTPRCVNSTLLGNSAAAFDTTTDPLTGATNNTGKYVAHIGGFKLGRLAANASRADGKVDDPNIKALDADIGDDTGTDPNSKPLVTVKDLKRCVLDILCGLSQPVRNEVRAFIQLQEDALEFELLFLKAQLVKYLPIAKGLGLAMDAFAKILAEAQAKANLVPLNLIGNCLTLGNLNVFVETLIAEATSDLQLAFNEVNRVLAFIDELNFAIERLEQGKRLLNAVLVAIESCPSILTGAPA